MDKDTLRSPGDQSVPAQRRRLLPVGTAKRWAGLQGDAPQEPARCPGPRFAPAPSRINTQTLLSTVLPVAGPVEPASRMPPPGRLPSAVSSPSAPTPSRSTTGAAFSSATSRWPSTPTSSPAPTTSRRIRRRCRPCWGRADRREVILWRGVERNWSPVRGPIPSPLPVLLPLEKGLRALAFVPNQSIERPGQRLSRTFRGGAPRTVMRRGGTLQRKRAPTVGASAPLPTLSLPLQGGDVGPTVSAEKNVSATSKANRSPLPPPRIRVWKKPLQGENLRKTTKHKLLDTPTLSSDPPFYRVEMTSTALKCISTRLEWYRVGVDFYIVGVDFYSVRVDFYTVGVDLYRIGVEFYGFGLPFYRIGARPEAVSSPFVTGGRPFLRTAPLPSHTRPSQTEAVPESPLHHPSSTLNPPPSIPAAAYHILVNLARNVLSGHFYHSMQ